MHEKFLFAYISPYFSLLFSKKDAIQDICFKFNGFLKLFRNSLYNLYGLFSAVTAICMQKFLLVYISPYFSLSFPDFFNKIFMLYSAVTIIRIYTYLTLYIYISLLLFIFSLRRMLKFSGV